MIKVAGRDSLLSQKQMQEVLAKLLQIDPALSFQTILVKTTGDLNQKTSLRFLGKTNFFTRQLDQMLLDHRCDMAIHSAKDLPEPIPEGLMIAAVTKGIDPKDALVMRDGDTFFSLPSGAVIATSSIRREEMVKTYRTDLRFIDLRGTIEQRIETLYQKQADGVIVAQAALIRLNLTHLNRFIFPDQTENLQGKLAILIRKKDARTYSFLQRVHGK